MGPHDRTMSDRRYVVVEDSTMELADSDLESLPDVSSRGDVWEMTTAWSPTTMGTMNGTDLGAKMYVAVSSLHVRCSYPMREDAIAASDACQSPANSSVLTTELNYMYRCPKHRGLIKGDEEGPVYETVPSLRPRTSVF